MTGQWEQRLRNLAQGGSDWNLPTRRELAQRLEQLRGILNRVASEPGLAGESGNAATESFSDLSRAITRQISYLENELPRAIDEANTERARASGYLEQLASGGLDARQEALVRGAAAGTTLVLGPFSFLAGEGAVQAFNFFMGQQREEDARRAVETVSNNLDAIRVPAPPHMPTIPGPEPGPNEFDIDDITIDGPGGPGSFTQYPDFDMPVGGPGAIPPVGGPTPIPHPGPIAPPLPDPGGPTIPKPDPGPGIIDLDPTVPSGPTTPTPDGPTGGIGTLPKPTIPGIGGGGGLPGGGLGGGGSIGAGSGLGAGLAAGAGSAAAIGKLGGGSIGLGAAGGSAPPVRGGGLSGGLLGRGGAAGGVGTGAAGGGLGARGGVGGIAGGAAGGANAAGARGGAASGVRGGIGGGAAAGGARGGGAGGRATSVAGGAPGGAAGARAGIAGGAAGGRGAGGASGAASAGGTRGTGIAGGGAQGGRNDRKGQQGRGLGGPIAERMEDDEEFGPLSENAGSGGRDDA